VARKQAAETTREAAAAQPAAQGLLDRIVEEGRLGRDDEGKKRGRDLVSRFVSQVLEGHMTVSPDLEVMINQRISQINHLLSIQLNEILHHPKFQQLEGTWRGIRYLMEQSETGTNQIGRAHV
jgi:type VI secretion system protein ImpC